MTSDKQNFTFKEKKFKGRADECKKKVDELHRLVKNLRGV